MKGLEQRLKSKGFKDSEISDAIKDIESKMKAFDVAKESIR